jgi:hypothetical protein
MLKTLTYAQARDWIHDYMESDRHGMYLEMNAVKGTSDVYSTLMTICRHELCQLTADPAGFSSGWKDNKIWVGKWILTEEADGRVTAISDESDTMRPDGTVKHSVQHENGKIITTIYRADPKTGLLTHDPLSLDDAWTIGAEVEAGLHGCNAGLRSKGDTSTHSHSQCEHGDTHD